MNRAPLSRRRAWWLAVRPFSFPASVVPVLVGTAAAAGEDFRPALFVLAFAGSLLIHAGTNLATDFFDFTHGVQPEATLGGAIQANLISARDVHRAAIACFTAGSVCGLIIVTFVGWPILAAGFASVLAGYFYTAAPISYSRRGLGEVMVFVFMGLVMVMASYYVQVEHLSWRAFWAALPVAILVANILHANNLRDIENDRARHKLTIASVLDRPASDYLLIALVIGAFVSVFGSIIGDGLPIACAFVIFADVAAWQTIRALRHSDPSALNELVRKSSTLHLHFGLLLALGLLVDAFT